MAFGSTSVMAWMEAYLKLLSWIRLKSATRNEVPNYEGTTIPITSQLA